MKKLTIILSLALLTGCATYSDVEKQALRDRAISDARNAPQEEHLAYLQCYALWDYDKGSCKRRIRKSASRKAAITWEYIHPYDYEAERLGFSAFIRNHGKNCDEVNEGAIFDKKRKVFPVKCTNGSTYDLKYDTVAEKWSME